MKIAIDFFAFACSALQPIFHRHNVRLIGVGLEELGVQEFIDGKFFDGGQFSILKNMPYQLGSLDVVEADSNEILKSNYKMGSGHVGWIKNAFKIFQNCSSTRTRSRTTSWDFRDSDFSVSFRPFFRTRPELQLLGWVEISVTRY